MFKNKRRGRKNAKSKHTLKAVEKKVAKIEKRDKPEVKRLQWGNNVGGTSSTNFILSTTNPAVILRQICPIERGLGQNQRIGSKVNNVRLEYAYDVLNTGAQASPAFVRIIGLYDKSPNQALPILSDIFDVNPYFPAVPVSNVCFKNVNYKSRFKFLFDHYHTMGSNGASIAAPSGGNIPMILHRHGSKKLNVKTIYSEAGISGLIGTITEGAFYLVAWASVEVPPFPAGNEIQFTGLFRLHYTDA